jgi:serine/threonine-protein kinase
MSRVFLAEEIALGRRVVVKVLEPALAEGLSADRFAREAKLAARLQDPRIVPVLAAGTLGDLPYYTMPYVDGESLRARMARPVSESEAIAILRDVALALEYAHGRDVVHRDIKPENVLLSGRTAVVTDFGIAKALAAATTTSGGGGTLTQLGTSLGTPAYMPPEQAAGDAADHRADVYSWGVMAYELLAGRHPFVDKKSAQQLIAAHIAEKPASLDSVRSGLPAKLTALVMRSLEKDPDARPQSARDLITALDVVSGSPRSALGASAAANRRWILVGAAVVVAVGVAGWLISRRSAEATNTDPALIAVMPFRVTSPDASLGYLREGMVDLVAAKLVRSPRAADQRAVLAAWRRAGGGPTQDVDHATASRLAAALGAGRIIEGTILVSGDTLTVNATIASTPNASDRGHSVAAKGAASQVAALVDSVVSKLLVLDAGESEQRLAVLASTPMPALEAYLAGQAAYRAGRYAVAADRFADALREDSTFALAGMGLMVASDWTLDPRGDAGRAVAVAHPEKLGVRDRLYLGPVERDSAVTTDAQALARRDAAVQAAPDSPDLWYRLGDNGFHYFASLTSEDEAWHRAVAALERGLALDSSYAPLLEHLPVIYEAFGDTARARLATVRLMRDTAAYYYPASRVLYAPDSASRAAAARDLESKSPFLAGYVAIVGLLHDVDMPFADDMLTKAHARSATAADRNFVAEMQFNMAMEQGFPGRAARIAAAEIPERQADRMFVATFWDGDSTAGAAQYAETKGLVSQSPPTDAGARRSWVTTIFDFAQYELARGDTTHAPAVIARLRALPPVPRNPVETVRPARLALILDAQLAALGTRRDAAQRLASLDSLLRLGPIGDHVRLAGNLVASRLWERAGNPTRAYEAVRRWTITTGPKEGALYATYLREQGRLAAAVNDREAAIKAYRRYLRLRRKPEPVLARDVATVRAELEKLEKQSAGR